ncbi:MAG: DUF2341 domain-containing protein [Chitinispirillaceae bacterium]|nr:DUF2341 domain-containing protein [Chitinispirillaceae bacterium]
MKHRLEKRTALLTAALFLTAGSTCVSDLSMGPGTGSETTNGIVALVRYQNGALAANATVKLRPADFLKDASSAPRSARSASAIDTVTDSAGRFSVRNLEPLAYAIEILDRHNAEGVLLRTAVPADSIVDFGVQFLNPLGSIIGTVDYSGLPDTAAVFCQMYGLDRICRIDVLSGSFRVDGIVCGRYDVRLFTSHPSYLPTIIEDVTVVSSVATSLDTVILTPLSNWSCSRRVHLNTTATGADVKVAIRKFPVLVRLTNENFDFDSAQPNGADIRFLKADNSPMPYHIEQWDEAGKRAEVWVKVDTVLGNNDSQYFVMVWGNPHAVDASNGTDVFDTAMGFAGVWHMNESDSAGIHDATGNHYNGRKYGMGGMPPVPGACGPGLRFDGESNYIVLSNTASSKLNFPEDGRYSVSAWIYAEALDNEYHSIVSKGNQQYGLQLTKDNMWQFFEFQHRTGWDGTEAAATSKIWKHLVGVRSGASQYLYVDGELVDSTVTATAEAINRITGDNVFIGRRTIDTTRFWNGMIDEVRICSWPHSENWIKLCYMNQKAVDELVEFR